MAPIAVRLDEYLKLTENEPREPDSFECNNYDSCGVLFVRLTPKDLTAPLPTSIDCPGCGGPTEPVWWDTNVKPEGTA